MKFSGVYTALITPFKNGEVDFESMKKLVKYQLDAGVHGLVVSGTTAESPTISLDEKKSLLELVRSEVAGQVPVVFGSGTNSTAETVSVTKKAESWRADAALVVVPYYNKPSQEGLRLHFESVAKSVEIPIILYNVPGRTITSLTAETIAKLSKLPNIIGIKEATGEQDFTAQITQACGNDFLVTSGDDAAFLKILEAGGRGIISVLSHILPREMVTLYQRLLEGDLSAHQDYQKYSDLLYYLYCESNPAPVKAAMQMMGVIESDELRLPMTAMTSENQAKLEAELKKLEILK